MLFTIPVDPDADEARRWAVDELSKAEYRAEPATWLARLGQWLRELFEGLDGFGTGLGPTGVILIVAVAVTLVALVVWLVVGPLRRSRRADATAAVLGDDRRSAEALEAAAAHAAAARDWDLAVTEIYRACVRSLDDRGVVTVTDGMTADEAARDIGAAVPVERDLVAAVARDFESARYGRGGLNEAAWVSARDSHERLRRAHRTAVAAEVRR
ncbi:DUF4129 domain-containing protein [Demequina sp. NBRC 110055]|uniref:DUF4129 domain-containing protein n=1 Tax=Demequina sp. NBRC 110055 TaxID=1570344 RepID=UPI000A05431F|nr:DUF4129 domain-containing protein [Demequina sp. NBRC 110055]